MIVMHVSQDAPQGKVQPWVVLEKHAHSRCLVIINQNCALTNRDNTLEKFTKKCRFDIEKLKIERIYIYAKMTWFMLFKMDKPPAMKMCLKLPDFCVNASGCNAFCFWQSTGSFDCVAVEQSWPCVSERGFSPPCFIQSTLRLKWP